MPTMAEPKEAATRAEQIFRRLRGDLLANRFQPSEPLRFERMRNLYKSGIAPLREALSRLSESGLVVQVGQKGFHAAPFSLEDLHDVVKTRRTLEVLAARDAAQNGSEQWEANLVATFHRFGKISRTKPNTPAERNLWEERHTEFHHALIAGCRSRWTRQLWSIVFDHAERYRRSAIGLGHWSENEYEDHKLLLDAAVSRDPDLLGDLLHNHIGVSAERLVAHLSPSLCSSQSIQVSRESHA